MSETLTLRSTFDYNLVSVEGVAHCNPKAGGELPTVEVLEVSTVELGKMHRVLGCIAFGFFRIIAAIAEGKPQSESEAQEQQTT